MKCDLFLNGEVIVLYKKKVDLRLSIVGLSGRRNQMSSVDIRATVGLVS